MSLHTWMLKNEPELQKHVSVGSLSASVRPGVFLLGVSAVIS